MKLRQSNPDWKMDGAMGAEGYLSKEQKEEDAEELGHQLH